jgi:hypothetical protein
MITLIKNQKNVDLKEILKEDLYFKDNIYKKN